MAIFRKISSERVNSPEQLNSYIRVVNPSVWLFLSAIVVLLVGVILWGVFGTIETKVSACVVAAQGQSVCYYQDQADAVSVGMTVSVNGQTAAITSIESAPVAVDAAFPDYAKYLLGLSQGDYCRAVVLDLPALADGVYSATICGERVRPISFVIH